MKRRVILIVLFFYLFHTAKAQWQTIFKDSLNYWCTSVHFINNDTGFVGTCQLQDFWFSGNVFRTLDGGQTWDTTNFYNSRYAVQFLNDSIGYAGGQDGVIARTTDMGENWDDTLFTNVFLDLFSLHFLNIDTGYCALSGHSLMRSIDGGGSWHVVFDSLANTSYPGRSKMIFTDTQTGYIAQRKISKTVDGGATWFNLTIPSNFDAYSIYFFDNMHGFAVGYLGKMTETFDGGATWSMLDSIGPYPLSDIAFVNDSIGYIVGGEDHYNYALTNGIIYKTIDGGNSWQVMDSSYYDGLLKIDFPSDSIGYVVGINGIILKITNANIPTAVVQQVSSPGKFVFSPNPASTHITLTGMPLHPGTEIRVTNTLGEPVFSEIISAAAERYQLPVVNFANGIYFLSVQTGKERITGKVVVNH